MAEQYSIQAETLMKAAVEEYKEILLEIDASDANESVLKGIRINIQGKPRRLVDVGDLKKTEDKNKLQILVFNTDHIELITEKIDEIDFNYEIDGQFINIDGQTRSECAIVPYVNSKFTLTDEINIQLMQATSLKWEVEQNFFLA